MAEEEKRTCTEQIAIDSDMSWHNAVITCGLELGHLGAHSRSGVAYGLQWTLTWNASPEEGAHHGNT